mgnify:CR=1 FL=1
MAEEEAAKALEMQKEEGSKAAVEKRAQEKLAEAAKQSKAGLLDEFAVPRRAAVADPNVVKWAPNYALMSARVCRSIHVWKSTSF